MNINNILVIISQNKKYLLKNKPLWLVWWYWLETWV